jgi:hypothetical protein
VHARRGVRAAAREQPQEEERRFDECEGGVAANERQPEEEEHA